MERKKHSMVIKQSPGFKGEIVDEKDKMDNDPTGRYMKQNPYKTPPNNLTTKNKEGR
ncbi:MAG: hypothetical protein ACOYWZ_19365 [Bacillota bacterium]